MTTRLRARLVVLGYAPQYLVAAKAGIHPYTFSQYCRGVREIPVRHLQSLARVLECNAESLVGDVDDGEAST